MRSLADLMDDSVLEQEIREALAEQSHAHDAGGESQPGKNNGIYPANSPHKPNSDDWIAAAAWNRPR